MLASGRGSVVGGITELEDVLEWEGLRFSLAWPPAAGGIGAREDPGARSASGLGDGLIDGIRAQGAEDDGALQADQYPDGARRYLGPHGETLGLGGLEQVEPGREPRPETGGLGEQDVERGRPDARLVSSSVSPSTSPSAKSETTCSTPRPVSR